ncbi:MAG: hypothetical protein ACPG9K_01140 [Poseidonibacter sp.]
MNIEEKNKWRLKFKVMSILVVLLTLIIGATLSWLDKGNSFAGIGTGVLAFCGAVFGADYFSTPKDNIGEK